MRIYTINWTEPFKEQIKLLLLSELSELPAKDRLKALEDYQRCIQNLQLTHQY